MMQPLPDAEVQEAQGRLSNWASHHQSILRMIILAVGLFLFFVFLPAYMRVYFWEGLLSHKVLTSMLLFFNLLAISLVWSTGQQVDAWTFLFFNLRGLRPIWLDRAMLTFTQIGSGITALGIALVLFLSGNQLFSYQFTLGSLTLWLVVELLKIFIHRARPFMTVTQARIVGYRASGQSFPSGHTSQAFFLATLLAQHFQFNIWVVFGVYVVAFLVGITRMYVGAHYPRDVLAGAILGSAWGLLGIIIDGYVLNGSG
jgi:membrane-associated phospholipid phosphatase